MRGAGETEEPAGAGRPAAETGGRDVLAEAVERMAHQIKNPLQAVAMNLEVIRTRLENRAPELWSDLEPYGDAVDDNVSVLDRRLGLLLQLGRRSPGQPREAVNVAALTRDFVQALAIDDERPAVRVSEDEPQLAARARPGYLLALVLDLWRTVRTEAPGAAALPVGVRAGEGEVTLEVRLPAGLADELSGGAAERWRQVADLAGGRLHVGGTGSGGCVRVVLPTD